MKKLFLFLSFLSIVFVGCETDFNVNSSWEEVAVVYGLLDAGEGSALQQIKISKAFLGEMDALQMAQYKDSINFDSEALDVKILRTKINGDIDSISLYPFFTSRDQGVFNDTIAIYTFSNANQFLKENSNYELIIKNKVTGNKVTGRTQLISEFSFDGLRNNYEFGFYNPLQVDSLKYRFKVLKWYEPLHGKIYQVDMEFRYLENNDTLSLIWSQPLVTQYKYEVKLEGVKFFNFLRNNIKKDDTKFRKFVDINVIMTVGTADLETYINVNQPVSGIVQERPQFTNIVNGLGLFSSRYTHVRNDVGLTDDTQKYLRDQLDRNFQ